VHVEYPPTGDPIVIVSSKDKTTLLKAAGLIHTLSASGLDDDATEATVHLRVLVKRYVTSEGTDCIADD